MLLFKCCVSAKRNFKAILQNPENVTVFPALPTFSYRLGQPLQLYFQVRLNWKRIWKRSDLKSLTVIFSTKYEAIGSSSDRWKKNQNLKPKYYSFLGLKFDFSFLSAWMLMKLPTLDQTTQPRLSVLKSFGYLDCPSNKLSKQSRCLGGRGGVGRYVLRGMAFKSWLRTSSQSFIFKIICKQFCLICSQAT